MVATFMPMFSTSNSLILVSSLPKRLGNLDPWLVGRLKTSSVLVTLEVAPLISSLTSLETWEGSQLGPLVIESE